MGITAEQVKALRVKVKNEMNRRYSNGSVSSYGTAEWDYGADAPVKEKKPLPDRVTK